MQKNSKIDDINTLRKQNEELNIDRQIVMSMFFPSEEEIQRKRQQERDQRCAATNAEVLEEMKYDEAHPEELQQLLRQNREDIEYLRKLHLSEP